MQDSEGKVVGATVRDNLSGKQHNVYARAVINAAGPFSDDVRQLSEVRLLLAPSAWQRSRGVGTVQSLSALLTCLDLRVEAWGPALSWTCCACSCSSVFLPALPVVCHLCLEPNVPGTVTLGSALAQCVMHHTDAAPACPACSPTPKR